MRGRSPDEDALLRAVWDAPNDDAPRLVYADWLDEHGEGDRAAFIRVQCELARVDEAEDRFLDLQKTEARLWKKNRARWTRGLPTHAQVYRRGFPVAGAHQVRLKQVPGLRLDAFDCCPTIHLAIQGTTGLWTAADWPGLARVGALRLEGHRTNPADLAMFLDSPFLTNLTSLELSLSELGIDGMRAVLESPVWPRLTRFVYRHNLGSAAPGLTGRPLELLAAARRATPLAELTLADPSLGPDDMKVLATAPLMAGLRDLSLGMSEIGSNGVMALAGSPHLGTVRGLDLSNVGSVSARAVEAVARAPGLGRLCRLGLGVVSAPSSVAEFLTSPHMTRLRALQVLHSRRGTISPGLARKIRARFGTHSLIRVED